MTGGMRIRVSQEESCLSTSEVQRLGVRYSNSGRYPAEILAAVSGSTPSPRFSIVGMR